MKKLFTWFVFSTPWLLACGPQPPITGTGGAGGGTAKNIPCDVDAILKAKCQTCHGSPLSAGAPMPLITYADTQAMRNGQPVWRLMQTRVGNGTMPPNTTLTPAEKTTMQNWFNANAPAGTQVCQGGPVDPGCIGPECLPCDAKVRITMYGGSEGSGQKFTVTPGQRYVNTNFANPFAPGGRFAGQYVIANAPITDNKAVIHHWILYGIDSSGGRTHVAGWAPGGNNSVLESDVMQDISMYTRFSMQVHYNNNTGSNQLDGSGVAFCPTTEKRTHVAGIFTLGTASIFVAPFAQAQTQGVCSVKRPMTIIGTSPHMHQIGYGFRTEHVRGGANLTDLSFIPNGEWSFEGQKHYPILPRREVQVGDTLRTTCYYKNPNATFVTFGPNTENEMCFDFMMVYPYGPLMRSCDGAAAP
ncbi:MAG TPA: hypothetical protein VK524_02555 [Polyangiaceae bacterium]|nr:hypothetical protein [Polyangiaceae bacterium]